MEIHKSIGDLSSENLAIQTTSKVLFLVLSAQLKSGVENLERAQRKTGKKIKGLKQKDPRGSQEARST